MKNKCWIIPIKKTCKIEGYYQIIASNKRQAMNIFENTPEDMTFITEYEELIEIEAEDIKVEL